MKAVEFDWHDFLSGTNISTLIQCVYHCCYLKSCKLFKVGTKHVKWVYMQLVFVSTQSLL